MNIASSARRRPLVAAFSFLVASALTCAAARADAPDQTPPPDYSKFSQTYHLPFAGKPVDFNDLRGMNVRMSINGSPPRLFQVDTGSVGIMVGADLVPNFDPAGAPGSITYSSSGVELDGVWNTVTITFVDSDDGHGNKATAVVPILAVTERKIHPGAVNGPSSNAAATQPAATQPAGKPHPFMLGIGFGRGKDPHPEKNAFVNLKEMEAGTMRRGYTITRDGITLGLSNDKVGTGWTFDHLKERTVSADTVAMKPGLKDWESSRGSVSVGGAQQPDAAMLYDTGLTNMMIGLPEQKEAKDIEPGTPITVDLLSGKLHYTFKVGDKADPVTPRRVTWVPRPEGGPSVNTGLRALSIYDYLYDAEDGYLGLRPTEKHN